MASRTLLFPFLLALPIAWAQSPTILSTDIINLRNFALSADGDRVVYAAGFDRFAQTNGSTNIYSTFITPNQTTTRLTHYENTEPLASVMALDLAATGRIVYTFLSESVKQEEEIHILDGTVDRVAVTDKEGCVRILCVNCYSMCVRNVHITSDGNTVLYAAARDQPFYTVTVNGDVRRRLDIFQGSLAPSGQRVISQAGKVVFTSAAPSGPTLVAQATDVYLMNLDGTGLQQVTHLGGAQFTASDAVISSNGTWIAFTRTEQPGGNAAPQVWIVKPDGTNLRRISPEGSPATSPSLSGDGSIVSFIQNGQVKQTSTNIDILALFRIVDVTKLVASAAQNAILSADGQRVGFTLGPPSGLPAAIYTAPITGDMKFEQLTPVYTPRMLFTPGLVSAGGTAPPSVGSLMTAYGTNLSTQEFSVASSLPLPTKLGGIELLASLDPMPLHAVTPWQINAQIAGSRFPETLSFRVRDVSSTNLTAEARMLVRATAPEAIPMHAVSQAGFLLAAAVFPGTRTLADAAHPAAANDTLEIYSLGLGATTPEVTVGAASPSSPPAEAKVKPRLQIGGRDADISFAGLVPGLAGVYQVNAKIPVGLAPGYQPLRWIAPNGDSSGTSGIYVR